MSSWKEIAAAKRVSLLSKIPAEWRLPEQFCASPATVDAPNIHVTTDAFFENLPGTARLSPQELEITSENSISELLRKYKAQQLTAEAVVTAFCHRAAINHQMTESLSEIRFDEAIAEAKLQDEHLRTHKELIGPLHGIPISVKDQFRVEGLETASGYLGWLGNVETADTESLLIKQVKSLGPIIIVKTRVPQALMDAELISNFGRPGMSPYNRLLSPGGTSGGEGSLVGNHGSVLGIGTDIGGSIRIPAAYNNLFGLKPSFGRLSYKGLATSLAGQPVVPAVPGPISTTVDNLIHFTRAMLATEGRNLDPALINLPWRSSMFDQVRTYAASRKLCFAVFPNDGVVRPHPTIARGIDIAIRALRHAGHRVVEWGPPSHLEGSQIYAGITLAAGGDIFDALDLTGEPPIPHVVEMFGTKDKPRQPAKMQDYYDLMVRFKRYQQRYAEYWESTKSLTGTGRPVDGIITPASPTAAVQHNCQYSYNYTILYNLLDYSSMTIPVTFADKSIDVPGPHEFMNELDEKNWKAYDAEIYHGAPIGIQVVSRRLEEEKVLALGQVLTEALNAISYGRADQSPVASRKSSTSSKM